MWRRAIGSGERHAHVNARFDALLKQVPLLYLVALSTFGGMYITAGGGFEAWANPVVGLAVLVLVRLLHWLQLRKRSHTVTEKRRTIRHTILLALVISLGFSVWAQHLLTTQPELALAVATFGGLAAIGCAYGLSSIPLAAAFPLALLGAPLGMRLLLASGQILNAVGLCLLLVSIIVFRIVEMHNRTTVAMLASRHELQQGQRKLLLAEKLAMKLARVDPLTELANRRAFLEILQDHLSTVNAKPQFALALLDLDKFKPINDVFGHAAGDELLSTLAANLRASLPKESVLARMGGDEFAVLVPGSFFPNELEQLAKRLCEAARQPINIGDRNLTVGASCGIAYCQEALSAGEALSRADQALYTAKANPERRFALFNHALQKAQERQNTIERLLMNGQVCQHLTLAYQPIVDLRKGGKIVAVEALARWHDDVLGDVSPAEFIPIAERNGVIGEVGGACFTAACAAIAPTEGLILSFNISAVQLSEPTCSQHLLNTMHGAAVDPSAVQLEVTETALLTDLRVARDNLRRLQQAGCKIALDDFGVGNASLTYLREMQFDVVKLDGSLVAGIAESSHCRRLLKACIDLCHTMGMSCVAEMVETADQLMVLRSLGCDAAQGNCLGRPLAELPPGFARYLAAS